MHQPLGFCCFGSAAAGVAASAPPLLLPAGLPFVAAFPVPPLLLPPVPPAVGSRAGLHAAELAFERLAWPEHSAGQPGIHLLGYYNMSACN